MTDYSVCLCECVLCACLNSVRFATNDFCLHKTGHSNLLLLIIIGLPSISESGQNLVDIRTSRQCFSISLWNNLPASAISQSRSVSTFRTFLYFFYKADKFSLGLYLSKSSPELVHSSFLLPVCFEFSCFDLRVGGHWQLLPDARLSVHAQGRSGWRISYRCVLLSICVHHSPKTTQKTSENWKRLSHNKPLQAGR